MTARLVTRMLPAVLIVAVLAVAPAADAWGPKGHRLVGLVAKELLDPDARAAIKDIMGSDDLATFALFMDINKATLAQQIPGSRDWHYDDIPTCPPPKTKADYCKLGNCATTQIAAHEKDLVDAHADQKFALQVLAHLIGDIHQPLHGAENTVGTNNDRGGNDIKVSLPAGMTKPSKPPNLHSVWDTAIVERQFQGKTEAAIVTALVAKFKDRAASEDWAKGTADDWIGEAHKLAVDVAYGKLPTFACNKEMEKTRIKLPMGYIVEGGKIAEEQIAKAGFRLAATLNRLLGQ